jgi:hypothetical protein
MKVLSLNCEKRMSTDIRRLVVKTEPDYICFQEYHQGSLDIPGLFEVFKKAELRSGKDAGVAIISRRPADWSQGYLARKKEMWPISSRKPMIQARYGKLSILNIHGHNGRPAFFGADPKPLIEQLNLAGYGAVPQELVIGDFNTDSNKRHKALASWAEERGFSEPRYVRKEPGKFLDGYCYRGLELTRLTETFYGLSDHPAFLVEFK